MKCFSTYNGISL